MFKSKILFAALLFSAAAFVYAAPPELIRWVSLSSDARDKVRETIRVEVEKREGFSTAEEERLNIKAVEDEKDREDSAYKKAIIAANKEFIRAKKKRDDLNAQFQATSSEFDEFGKSVKTIRVGIENLDNQISLYEQDIKAQRDSLKKWLQTEKQGEALAAVIYVRGFKDRAHTLESEADHASAPLLVQKMGTFIQSSSTVINNVLTSDFIRAIEEGTAKWNNEEPLRMELEKGDKGTTYLRLKRYELYPFQDNKSGRVKQNPSSIKYKVAMINSRKDLEAFMIQNQFSPKNYELGRADALIKDTIQNNSAAEEALNEQVKSFQERISALQDKAGNARGEKESQKMLLKRKEEAYARARINVSTVKAKKDAAEDSFKEAQAALHEKKKLHESIIIKTALATTKGSQTPAEASSESIIDKLAEVKNDAKTQHSSSTTEVTNFKVSAESSTQAITEARIIGVRLISFVNEGDSVRVNMAFRVRTVLEEQEDGKEAAPREEPKISSPKYTADETVSVAKPAPKVVTSPPNPIIVPFKRSYHPLATKDALGCLFDLKSVTTTKEGLRVVLEVINTETEVRSIAFYDDRFGSWSKSRIYDDSNKYYETSQAYVIRDGQKVLMVDIDRRGRGIAVDPQQSRTMELFFNNIPATVKTFKINLHPFIYYRNGWREAWQEFDLPMPNLRLYSEAPESKAPVARTKKKR